MQSHQSYSALMVVPGISPVGAAVAKAAAQITPVQKVLEHPET